MTTRRRRVRALWGTEAIFLLDGLGAIVTAVSVGLVLPLFHEWIGLPVRELRILGGVALSFAAFSLSCQLLRRVRPATLRAIAVANLSYCVATAVLLAMHLEEVTTLGVLYFGGEIAIVTVLAWRELSLAREIG